MPNIKSAAKRLRQSIVRRDRNRSVRSALRGGVRKVREAIAAGNAQDAQAAFATVARNLDKAGAARVIHPNAAARTKSRLQQQIKKLK